jgi:DnaJ like chaperone protein
MLSKLAGGALGWAVGGPIGAVLGAVAGGTVDEDGRETTRGTSTEPDRSTLFMVAVVSLLAKIAKADGRVSKKEIRVADEFFRTGLGLDGADRKAAIRIFEAAKDDAHDFEDFAIQIYQLFDKEQKGLRNLMDVLMRLGCADGRWHPGSLAKLQRVGRIFDYSDAEFEQLKAIHLPDPSEPYRILGLEPGSSRGAIKKAYARLVKDFHPDRVAAKDLPPAFLEFAQERFRRIQEAYEALAN